jgi:flavin-dependent thymidylate synthase
MSVKLIAYSQGVNGATPEDLLSVAFSKCYQRPASIDAVLNNLKHSSVLEHIQFSFDIQLSRVAWEQLTRHRLASFTAQSHRYTNIEKKDLSFFIPSEVKHSEDCDEWLEDSEVIYNIYRKWRNKGFKKETARYLAPIGVSINATVSFNLRSLLNLLVLRTKPEDQEEIRLFAEDVWQEVRPLFPKLADSLEEKFR